MALIENQDGSHIYVPDPVSGFVPGMPHEARLRTAPRPLGAPDIFTQPVGGRSAPGLHYFRAVFYENRAGIKQRGTPVDHGKMAAGDLVGDDQGIARQPFMTYNQATPDPTAPLRIVSANVFNRLVMACYDPAAPALYAENSSTDPTVVAIAGFAPITGASGLVALGEIHIGGVPYLGIGWATATAGNHTLQFVSALSPYTSGGLATVGTAGTWGFAQTAVDRDSLLIYNGTRIISMPTDVVIGVLVPDVRAQGLRAGGYVPGIGSLGGAGPYFWVVEPLAGDVTMHFPGPAQSAEKGRLLAFDLRGLLVQFELKFPGLKWITYATLANDGVFACDAETHFFHYGSDVIAVDDAIDAVLRSDKRRWCRGHWVQGGYIFWETEDVDTSGASLATITRRWRFNPQNGMVQQVSREITYTGFSSTQMVGGWQQPASQQSDFLYHYAAGQWWYQYNPPANVTGYSKRHSTGAAAGTGQEFEPTTSYISTAIRFPDHPGAIGIVTRVIGPPVQQLRESQDVTGYTQPARIDGTVGGMPFSWRGDEAPYRERNVGTYYGVHESAFNELQLYFTVRQQEGGTSPTRKAVNPWPITVEGYLYVPPMDVPDAQSYRMWDIDAWSQQ